MLTINHDNYETWLMLYIDNDLTAAEREAVEAFAKANPAVQEELDGLKDTILQPEFPVAMPGKERLLMPEIWNEEALTPQQQQLLLLTDNELPAAEKASLEMAISNDPLLQKEWGLLQNTRVATGKPLEMPGKDTLFRHERTRVIPIGRILKFAVAAAILGFGWFIFYPSATTEQDDTAGSRVAVTTPGQGHTPMVKNDSFNTPKATQVQPLKEANLASAGSEKKAITVLPSVQRVIAKKPMPEVVDLKNEVAVNQPTGDNYTSPVTRDASEKIASIKVVEVEGVTGTEETANINTSKVEVANLHPVENPVTAYEVVNPEDLTEEEGTISIAGARIPKQKIRNVYRNFTRPIARKLERSGNQLAYSK